MLSVIMLHAISRASWHHVVNYLKKSVIAPTHYLLFENETTPTRNSCFPIGASAQCCKPFYTRNSQMFVISQTVCHFQAFLCMSNICGQGQERTIQLSTWKVLHSGRRWPYSQTLGQAGGACEGQTVYLIMDINKLRA